MNVYDFDKTIYKYDSPTKFYFFCIKRHKKLIFHLFKTAFWGALKGLGIISLQKFKEKFFSFVQKIPNIEQEVKKFWDKEFANINYFYFDKRKKGDVICSASPYFLIEDIAKRVNESSIVICSEIDEKTGKFASGAKNCKGEEKVARLREAGYEKFEQGYGDSKSDIPMLKMCEQPFRIKNGKVTTFNEKYFEKNK